MSLIPRVLPNSFFPRFSLTCFLVKIRDNIGNNVNGVNYRYIKKVTRNIFLKIKLLQIHKVFPRIISLKN